MPLGNILALRNFPRQEIAAHSGAPLAMALHASATERTADAVRQASMRIADAVRHASTATSRRKAPRPVEDAVVVKIITPSDKNALPGKLAEAELYFTEGVLDGLKLIGFTIWERRSGSGRNVTFPARSYSVNGERRSFALLRPAAGDATSQDHLREMILDAYTEFEEKAAVAS